MNAVGDFHNGIKALKVAWQAGGILRDAAVSRRAVNLLHALGLLQLPYEGVFTATAAKYKNSHVDQLALQVDICPEDAQRVLFSGFQCQTSSSPCGAKVSSPIDTFVQPREVVNCNVYRWDGVVWDAGPPAVTLFCKAISMKNSFGSRSLLRVGNREFEIYRLDSLEKQGLKMARLPYSLRILLENLLRREDGESVTAEMIRSLASYSTTKIPTEEIAFMPSRVLLQDLTGVPAIVDLAAMRDAMKALGGDAGRINPLQPVELVIDHSVQVDEFGTPEAFKLNAEIEYSRNRERYAFLRWGQKAFENLAIVPPDTGICPPDQPGISGAGSVCGQGRRWQAGRLSGHGGWNRLTHYHDQWPWRAWLGRGRNRGRGGHAGAADFNAHPASGGRAPERPIAGGFHRNRSGVDDYADAAQEGRGRQVCRVLRPRIAQSAAGRPGGDREHVARVRFHLRNFPGGRGDAALPAALRTLRRPSQAGGKLLQGAGPVPHRGHAGSRVLRRGESRSGDGRAQHRRPQASAGPRAAQPRGCRLPRGAAFAGEARNRDSSRRRKRADGHGLRHGSVVIAAITSCTNTSNPALLMAAGLVAKKAVERGLKVPSWVKTSLAPGSLVVTEYLKKAGLTPYLDKLRFNLVGYGCTTCIGNSGPLTKEVSDQIGKEDLVVAAVLSGNRNFEGRIHSEVRANYLMAPPLVVAFALAGRADWDVHKEPVGRGSDGKPVYLKEIWPTQKEVDEAMKSVSAQMFRETYSEVFKGPRSGRPCRCPKATPTHGMPRAPTCRIRRTSKA